MVFTYLRKVGDHITSGFVSGPWASFCSDFRRQRKHISQLEQKVRESELQVHSALLGRPAPFGDVCLLRLQVSLGSQDGTLLVITQLALVGIQETENGPSEVRYSCPQKVNILIIKHFLFCS